MGKWLPMVIGILLIISFLIFAKSTKDKAPDSQVSDKKLATSTKEMVPLKGGTFTMGSEEGDGDESPVHTVLLTPFLIDACEITQADFEKLMGKNPSKHKGQQKPVDSVAWSEAAQYCNLRSKKEGYTPCYDEATWMCNFQANGYRLPTEAEWEYSYRAGTDTKFYFGNDKNILKDYGWYSGNSKQTSQEVGQKKPNAWGLYDMAGNVCEWVNDYYQDGYYSKSEKEDPKGPSSGFRLTRGGSFQDDSINTRSSFRKYNDDPEKTQCGAYDMLGFRCVRRINSEVKIERKGDENEAK